MGDSYELAEAKLLSSNGVIVKTEILPQVDGDFEIKFSHLNGEEFYLKTQRGSIRKFKSLDSAFATIQSLGISCSKLEVIGKVD